jgi:manganese-dependent inorganic pyrophosphatase
MGSSSVVYVVGHRNPDTDAIASAIGYAWLLSERDGLNTQAARAGSINKQTRFALDTFGMPAPLLLEDASPRFESIVQNIPPLNPAEQLAEAWQFTARTNRIAPVIDIYRRPLGMVTGQSVFEYLSKRLNMADEPFRELIRVPCGEACDRLVPKFKAADRISDHRDSVLRDQRDDFWVVDRDGKYMGTCTRADMMKPPRVKLVLVDHNEAAQSVEGLLEAELLEVLDHHRLGTTVTSMPIAFHVDITGSTSTLVAERMRMARLTPPAGVAGMLLSGLISDTLMFKSPTTTPRDKASAVWLAWHAFGVDEADDKMSEYGEALLRTGADLSKRSAQDIVQADFKMFESGQVKFGVSQVEVTNFNAVMDREAEVRSALETLREQKALNFTALMITDIVENDSLLICAGDVRYFERLPFARKGDNVWDLPGFVSRKKQLLPMLLGMFE